MKITLAAILAIAMMTGLALAPASAQQSEYVTVSTDMESYADGDVIVITGQVLQRHTGGITIQVHSPNNDLVAIGQPMIGPDNMFTFTLLAGDTMRHDGMYTVTATYSLHVNSPRIGQTTFMYTAMHTPGMMVDGTEFEPQYDIMGGSVMAMHTNPQTNSMLIDIESADDGQITITLPRELIDSQLADGTDDQFFVLIDGEEVYYNEMSSGADSRTINVEFYAGTSQIEIVGTSVAVPEFGTIAVVVLAGAITSIIVLSARSRLSLVPKL